MFGGDMERTFTMEFVNLYSEVISKLLGEGTFNTLDANASNKLISEIISICTTVSRILDLDNDGSSAIINGIMSKHTYRYSDPLLWLNILTAFCLCLSYHSNDMNKQFWDKWDISIRTYLGSVHKMNSIQVRPDQKSPDKQIKIDGLGHDSNYRLPINYKYEYKCLLTR